MSPETQAKRRAANSKWKAKNVERVKAYRKQWYAEQGPDYWRRWNGYPQATRPKPSLCEICGNPPGKQAMNLDHCHTTGTFRGWLCQTCNRVLGLFADNSERFRKAAQYLDNNNNAGYPVTSRMFKR